MCTGMLASFSSFLRCTKVIRQAYCDKIRIPTWISGGRTGFSRLHLYLEDDSDEMCVLSG